MIGIVIAAHGSLPDALLESTQMIIGDVEQVATVSLMPGDSLEGLVERIRDAVQGVNTGDGVLIFLDLFGGTPSNASALLTQEIEKVFAVTGVNFPMLAEVFMSRPSIDNIEELTTTAVSSGQTGIINVVEAFKKFKANQ
jgi:mannose/fructose/sorbose-specific phosphotransferase system IIA component